ncbi:MAG: ureidoglycolate lyase [Paracoccaceae bacterium]
MILTPEPLSSKAFAPFGEVIEADPATASDINDGFTTRFHALANVTSDREVIISIFRGRVRRFDIAMLERHPLGSQAFMPLGGRDWIAVVAERPAPESCRAFLCGGGQGVNYRAGVWHHPLLVLSREQDFVVVDRAGAGDNLQEVRFDRPCRVRV